MFPGRWYCTFVGLVREGRAKTVQEHADLQVADDEQRRQDLDAEDAAHGGQPDLVSQGVIAAFDQGRDDLLEDPDELGAGAAGRELGNVGFEASMSGLF